MKGKEKCKLLKEIRKQIAANNDIEYIVEECRHKGDCRGTCPKCESELRMLERELIKRKNLGKTVAVVGLSASLLLSASACTDEVLNKGGETGEQGGFKADSSGDTSVFVTDGIILPPESDEASNDTLSDVNTSLSSEDESTELIILDGDIDVPEFSEDATLNYDSSADCNLTEEDCSQYSEEVLMGDPVQYFEDSSEYDEQSDETGEE